MLSAPGKSSSLIGMPSSAIGITISLPAILTMAPQAPIPALALPPRVNLAPLVTLAVVVVVAKPDPNINLEEVVEDH
jgi:hypothetical protein